MVSQIVIGRWLEPFCGAHQERWTQKIPLEQDLGTKLWLRFRDGFLLNCVNS